MAKWFKNPWIQEVLNSLDFKTLTEIQKKSIPLILDNKNVIGVSETGTGKTYCFLFPIFDSIDLSKKNIQSIIISPTRELAKQIYVKANYFKKFNNDIKISTLIGGTQNNLQIISKNPPHLLIATPKKLNDLLTEYKVNLLSVNKIILDEADMLVDLGFFPLIDSIFSFFKKSDAIQKIAFSATLHETLSVQLSKYFKNTEIVKISNKIWKHKKINHYVIHYKDDKEKVFLNLVNNINPYFCIVFANTKKDVEMIYKILYKNNKNVLQLHGGLSSRDRKNVFKDIQNNNLNFLVATDLASRGIDIDGASHIISWNMPKEDIWYIHRSGRTGRSNYYGDSYVFLDNSTSYQIIRLQKKGINWNNKKYSKGEFIDFDYKFKNREKKETEVDVQIRKIIQTSSKKVKPNYKKKIKLKINEVKRKAKRNRIEELVNKERIKKYKIENAKKSKDKN
ncbi:DEAD/DEAH box helicase [Malacoplasma muris]|uniref:DEAD/DEAH box helicase n=1 Tax=Malacoplasma muris TaxID=2119 RepID=UPI00398E46B7